MDHRPPRLSAAVLVGAEAGMVGRTVPSWLGQVDEICLVSTRGNEGGVRDELAEVIGAELAWPGWGSPGAPGIARARDGTAIRTVSDPWMARFDVHRQESCLLATAPWVLIVDCDERLEGEPGGLVRRLELVELGERLLVDMGAPARRRPTIRLELDRGTDQWFRRVYYWPDGWLWRFASDSKCWPLGPAGELLSAGAELLDHSVHEVWIDHLRSATRPSSIQRKAAVLAANPTPPDADDDEHHHDEGVRAFVAARTDTEDR